MKLLLFICIICAVYAETYNANELDEMLSKGIQEQIEADNLHDESLTNYDGDEIQVDDDDEDSSENIGTEGNDPWRRRRRRRRWFRFRGRKIIGGVSRLCSKYPAFCQRIVTRLGR